MAHVQGPIPAGIAVCCRKWIVPLGPGARCGLCNTRPLWQGLLPEAEWPTPTPPIRPQMEGTPLCLSPSSP